MRSSLKAVVGAVALTTVAASTSSCATYSDKTEAARDALRRGNYETSVKELNRILKVRKPDDLPDKWKKNYELVVLERASILQAMGMYELSARDFGVAEKKLEFLDLARDTAGNIGKWVYSDSATKYKTTPTEKLSLNAINMVNYLARGDLNGAKVEAKRFTTMRNYFADYDPEHEHGAFGSYLAGFVHEKLGNADTALRYYDEALSERDFGSLVAPIQRLSKTGSYRGERIKDYLPSTPGAPPKKAEPKPKKDSEAKAQAPKPVPVEPAEGGEPKSEPPPTTDATEAGPPADATADVPIQRPTPPTAALGSIPSVPSSAWNAPEGAPAEILVVAKVGRVPHRIPKRIPIGAAVGLAGAYVTGDTTLLEYGMFKVLTYPELTSARNLFVDAEMRIDGDIVPLEEATDIASEVIAEFDELRPKIIGAALTRMIVRAAAAEGARAAGKQSESAGGLVGFLAAAAVEGTLVALDKPDTRSWSTLPARVYVGRLEVPPGAHKVEVTAFGPGGKERHSFDVKLAPGGYIVLDVTTLR